MTFSVVNLVFANNIPKRDKMGGIGLNWVFLTVRVNLGKIGQKVKRILINMLLS